jgi:mannose-1-phosphate guanylyltransferase/mannose-6-phosphate isomerase
MNTIIPVILCGGSGTRLWPLSRTQTPKQFLRLMNNMTLLQKTVQRTLDITGVPESNVVTVTLDTLKAETIRQLNEMSIGLSNHVLGEPDARNTAAAVAYAASYTKRYFGEESLMWILPADHYIGDEDALQNALSEAIEIADRDYLVTFGITPTRPETGYGYMLKSAIIPGSRGFTVEQFVEKPPLQMAEKFISSGLYLWSSGMHVFKAETVISSFQELAPEIFASVNKALDAGENSKMPAREIYESVYAEPFGKAVLERAKKIAVVPTDPQWSDIGSFESLWEIKTKNQFGNSMEGKVICQDTIGSMIMSQDKLVTCIGMKDIIVIETSDSILVANKKCSEAIKTLVSTLQKLGRREIDISDRISHGWGSTRLLSETSAYRLREVLVNPGKISDQQINHDCTGYWVVANGEALIMFNEEQKHIGRQETLTVPFGSVYCIGNFGTEQTSLLEFQYLNQQYPARGNIDNFTAILKQSHEKPQNYGTT